MSSTLFVSGIVCLSTIMLGMVLVVQTLLNSKASVHFSFVMFGTALSFTIGTGLLTILVILEGTIFKNNNKIDTQVEEKPKTMFLWSSTPNWYLLLAGSVGVIMLTAGLIVTYYVGSALFWVPLVVGQITCSAVLDHYGISLNGERKPFSLVKGFAVICTFVGAALSVYNKLVSELNKANINIGSMIGLILLSLAIGFIFPFQAVLNRNASKLLYSKLTAVWWSFLEGAIYSNIALIVQLCLNTEAAKQIPAHFMDSVWFMYCGGPIGVLYVASSLWFTGIVGFELFFVCLVSGQLAGSLLFDSVPLFGAESDESASVASSSAEVKAERIIGIFLVILGACLIRLKIPPLSDVKSVVEGFCCGASGDCLVSSHGRVFVDTEENRPDKESRTSVEVVESVNGV